MPLLARLVLLAFAVWAAAGMPCAAAAPVLSVTASHPGTSATLGRDAPLHLRLAYRSEVPIRVQAKGYFEGAEVRRDVRWNPSPAYPAGDGEAMVWIAYGAPARLDRLDIEVSDANWRPLAVMRLPVGASWSATLAPRAAEPEWVARLNAPQQAFGVGGDEELPWSLEMLLGPGLMIGLPGYFVLQVLLVRRYSGLWLAGALAPLAIMVPMILHAAFAFLMGSNLWPIFVILAAPFLFLYLCALAVVHFLARGPFARAG
ncbi:hypothetical protein ACUN0C_08850 [Faunimonas sp. B44]|uniref:hypothetical protein n=1 Tax=Faunimonas sp. B44 TaxID=3461493 RepID=UPI0040450161